jgi:hypothetical protein
MRLGNGSAPTLTTTVPGSTAPYHRTRGALALAADLEALDSRAELTAWLAGGQTVHSAVLLAESGAADDRHNAAIWGNFLSGVGSGPCGQGFGVTT